MQSLNTFSQTANLPNNYPMVCGPGDNPQALASGLFSLQVNIHGINILTGKRNATVKLCHVLLVAHKHEIHKLTMTRNFELRIGVIFVDFVYQLRWLIYMYIFLTAVTIFPS